MYTKAYVVRSRMGGISTGVHAKIAVTLVILLFISLFLHHIHGLNLTIKKGNTQLIPHCIVLICNLILTKHILKILKN